MKASSRTFLRRRVPRAAAVGFAAALVLYGAFSFALQLAEIAVAPRRLARHPAKLDAHLFASSSGALRADRRWLWDLAPSTLTFELDVSSAGFRGPELPREKGGFVRVAVLGDSMTLGVGVHEADSWPRLLEQSARYEGYRIDVLNAAMPGFTAAQGRAFYRGRVRGESPDVVVASFGVYAEALDGDGGLSDFERIADASRVGARIDGAIDRFGALRVIRSRAGATGTSLSATHRRPRLTPSELEGALLDLAADVRSDGHGFAILLPVRDVDPPPAAPLREYDDACRRAATRANAPLVDVAAARRNADGTPRTSPSLLERAQVLTLDGATQTANAVGNALRDRGWLGARSEWHVSPESRSK